MQCLTCGSRLRVTDPAIVDTIAACPKCNSMVQIHRPPTVQHPTNQQPASQLGGQIAVGQSDVDSQAITEDGIAYDEEGSLASEEMPVGFSGSEDLDADESAASAVLPQWQSERTQRSRQIAMVVALSLSGLLTAVAVFSWFVRSWRQTSASTTAETVSSIAQQPSVAAPILTEGSSDNATDSATSPPVVSRSGGDQPTHDSAETPPLSDPKSDEPIVAQPIPQDLLPQSPIAEPPMAEAPTTTDPVADKPDDRARKHAGSAA